MIKERTQEHYSRLIIMNGHIKTMAGYEIANGFLIVEDGKIKSLGDMDQYVYQEGYTINANGSLVMPGIIEAHCHMGICEEKKAKEGEDCNEYVNPITPHLRGIDAINPMDAAFNDAVRAGITSAMIGPGSTNVVGGQFVFVKTRGRCIDDMVVKEPAAMKIAFGENPKSNFTPMKIMPASRMGIAALLRKELTMAINYKRKKEKDPDCEISLQYESWLPVLDGTIPVKAHVHRADDILTAIRIAEEFNLRMTLDHCSEGHLIKDILARKEYPAILGPGFSCRNKIEVQNMAFKTAGILNKAGVLTAITTDHPVSLIQLLPLCAGMAVKAGLDLEAGYESITINPAKICGVDDRVGSLEPGKDADIAIFDRNPMKVFSQTQYVMIDGNIYFDYREDKQLL